MQPISLRLFVLALCLYPTTPVQVWAAKHVNNAVSTQQIDTGMALYAHRCGACHDVPSRSLDDAPPLVGSAFAQKWLKKPTALFDKIRYSMPQDNPGTLTDDEARSVVSALASGKISGKAPAK